MKIAKRKNNKTTKGPSKTRSRRTQRANQAFKRKPQLPSKIKNQIQRGMYEQLKKLSETTRRKNKTVTKVSAKTKNNIKKKTVGTAKLQLRRNENRKSKLITVKEDKIYSFKDAKKDKPKYTRKSYEIEFDKSDIIDVQEVDDVDLMYEIILPYLKLLLKKIRKPREWFSLHLWYKTNDLTNMISTEYTRMKPIPEAQEKALKELLEMLINEKEVYKNLIDTFFITGLTLRTYKDVSTRTNKKRKPVQRRKKVV